MAFAGVVAQSARVTPNRLKTAPRLPRYGGYGRGNGVVDLHYDWVVKNQRHTKSANSAKYTCMSEYAHQVPHTEQTSFILECSCSSDIGATPIANSLSK